MNTPSTPSPGTVMHSAAFPLTLWPLPGAAALARRRLYRDLHHMAPHLSQGGRRRIVSVDLRWYSPTVHDGPHQRRYSAGGRADQRMPKIAAQVLKRASARGLATAPTAYVLTTTARSAAASARIEIDICVASQSPLPVPAAFRRLDAAPMFWNADAWDDEDRHTEAGLLFDLVGADTFGQALTKMSWSLAEHELTLAPTFTDADAEEQARTEGPEAVYRIYHHGTDIGSAVIRGERTSEDDRQ